VAAARAPGWGAAAAASAGARGARARAAAAAAAAALVVESYTPSLAERSGRHGQISHRIWPRLLARS
jgi:hypothetical protein